MTCKKMSVRGFFYKKRYETRSLNGRLQKKPLQRKAEQGKNAGTFSGARFPGLSNFEKHVMCSRNMGAHVQRSIRST
jgi:hypothetical protein